MPNCVGIHRFTSLHIASHRFTSYVSHRTFHIVRFTPYAHRTHTLQVMSPKALAYTEVDAPGTAFGLGVSVVVDPSIVTHMTSKGCFSWGGAASTLFWVDPQEDLVVRKTSRM